MAVQAALVNEEADEVVRCFEENVLILDILLIFTQ